MPDTFFTVEIDDAGGEWFVPTDHARGPWDAEACHAGPPTALLVRALERALPGLRLCRTTVELGRTVPMAGFRVHGEVVRSGRATGGTRAAIVDEHDVTRVSATGMHVAAGTAPMFPAPLDNSGLTTPRLADSAPGDFPMGPSIHGRPTFRNAVEMRYPPGETPDAGATTSWMRTVPLLPDEAPSPFQRICPLADCGNALSRHADPDRVQFVNTDLTIALHRDPVGQWLGSRAAAHWQPTGVGLADALLFDDDGPVGRALQTMILRSVR
ncbi:MAG: thioesterase family protein [Acidimicrobiia bacterium]|nr:thioesterase family protein [Acidimicrobiia bacterium]